MSLFKNDDFKNSIKISGAIDLASDILPYEQDAVETYIYPYLSANQYNALAAYYNASSPTPDAALNALLPYVQRALARFMMLLASPSMDINVGATGYTTKGNTGNLVPASEKRVAKFDNSVEQLGWNNIETMLQFLETNKTNYPLWVASDAYTMHITGIVNTAQEFNKEHNIANSRLTFTKYRPAISRIETIMIRPRISDALFDLIVSQIKSNSLSVANAKLVRVLRTAIVMFAVSEQENDKHHRIAVQFLSEACKILDTSPNNYPTYRDSDVYRGGSEADYTHFTNTEENKIYVAGAPIIQ